MKNRATRFLIRLTVLTCVMFSTLAFKQESVINIPLATARRTPAHPPVEQRYQPFKMTSALTSGKKWQDECKPQRMIIQGEGMKGVNSREITLNEAAQTDWLVAQVAGKFDKGAGQSTVPESVEFVNGSLQSTPLTEPTTNTLHGYTFEANVTDLLPTPSMTAQVNSAGNTARGLILYAKQQTPGHYWTSIGYTTHQFVHKSTIVESIPLPEQRGEVVDLEITAVIIDNDDYDRIINLRVSSGQGDPLLHSIAESTNGPGLNLVTLTLPQVPPTAKMVEITLESPQKNGDSVILVGVDVSYRCQAADLALDASVSNEAPTARENVTYTLTVTNKGPDRSTNIEITDALPEELSSIKPEGPGEYINETRIWQIDPLAVGESATLTWTDKIPACPKNGQTIANTSHIARPSRHDPNAGNNWNSIALTVNCANLTLDVSVNDPIPYPSTPTKLSEVVYTVVVTNNGPDTAEVVELIHALPAGLDFQPETPTLGSYDPRSGKWHIFHLLPSETATLTVGATVKPCTNGREIPVRFAAASDAVDAERDSNERVITIKVESSMDAPCQLFLPLLQKPPAFQICYEDDFSDPDSRWPQDSHSNVEYGYDNGEYFVRQVKSGSPLHHIQTPIDLVNLSNYKLAVQARWDGSEGFDYGLIFGGRQKNHNSEANVKTYRFIIDPNEGRYRLRYGKEDDWKCVNKPGASADDCWEKLPVQIPSATSTNYLSVECHGNTVSLFVNKNSQLIWTKPVTETCVGYMGVEAQFKGQNTSAVARFDDFRVTSTNQCPPKQLHNRPVMLYTGLNAD